MWVYLTRPSNYSIVSRGLDHVELWVQQPAYLHEPDIHDITLGPDGQELYFDKGWQAPYSAPTSAKFLIKQDSALAEKVMAHLWEAMLPCGVIRPQGQSVFDWLNEEKTPGDVYSSNAHTTPWDDIDFNCAISYKRFLLAVNLVTKETNVLTPRVYATFGPLKATRQSSEHWGAASLTVPVEYQTSERYPFPADCEKFPF